MSAVALGGAIGACARVGVGEVLAGAETGFPWDTLVVNLLGCALLALLPGVAAVRRHPLLPPLLGTGALGGFTTLSAWSAETHALVERGDVVLAVAYAAGTLGGCLLVVAAVDRLSTPRDRATFEAEEGDL